MSSSPWARTCTWLPSNCHLELDKNFNHDSRSLRTGVSSPTNPQEQMEFDWVLHVPKDCHSSRLTLEVGSYSLWSLRHASCSTTDSNNPVCITTREGREVRTQVAKLAFHFWDSTHIICILAIASLQAMSLSSPNVLTTQTMGFSVSWPRFEKSSY